MQLVAWLVAGVATRQPIAARSTVRVIASPAQGVERRLRDDQQPTGFQQSGDHLYLLRVILNPAVINHVAEQRDVETSWPDRLSRTIEIGAQP